MLTTMLTATLLSTPASAAALTALDRDGSIYVYGQNLSTTVNGSVDMDPVDETFTSTIPGTEIFEDELYWEYIRPIIGSVHHNEASYNTRQKLAVTTQSVGLAVRQESDISICERSPHLTIDNDGTLTFDVDVDADALLEVTYRGDLFNGADFISMQLVEVDPTNTSTTLFDLVAVASAPGSGLPTEGGDGTSPGLEGDVDFEFELDSDNTYELVLHGDIYNTADCDFYRSYVDARVTLVP